MANESSSYPIPGFIRAFFYTLSALSPSLAARVADPLFFKPIKFPIHDREKPFRAEAESGKNKTDLGTTHWFRLPGEREKILFVHGWSGRGSQFFELMYSLNALGYDVYTFDAPGHGEEVLKRTDMPTFVKSIHWMNHTFGPFHKAVGHSLGGMALWNAIREGVPITRMINIGSPSSIHGVIGDFAKAINARPVVVDRMVENLGKQYNVEPSIFNSVNIAPQNKQVEGLLVHDEGDGDVPIVHAEALSGVWSNSQFIRTTGLGHRKILRDPEVVKACTKFMDV